MFKCVNCEKLQLDEYIEDKFIENKDNGIYGIFKNYKDEFFPVCNNCVNDGKTFGTKFNKYFFPENTISYDKFQKIDVNSEEAKHFIINYYVPISKDTPIYY